MADRSAKANASNGLLFSDGVMDGPFKYLIWVVCVGAGFYCLFEMEVRGGACSNAVLSDARCVVAGFLSLCCRCRVGWLPSPIPRSSSQPQYAATLSLMLAQVPLKNGEAHLFTDLREWYLQRKYGFFGVRVPVVVATAPRLPEVPDDSGVVGVRAAVSSSPAPPPRGSLSS